MPIDSELPLKIQTPDIVGGFQKGMENALSMQHQQQSLDIQRRQMALQEENGAAQREDRLAEAEKRRQQANDISGVNSAYQAGTTREQVLAAAKANGNAHLVPLITKQFDEADAASAKQKEARTKAEEADTDYAATLAAGVLPWLKQSPEQGMQAAQTAIKHAEEQGHDMSEWKQYLAQNPGSLQQVVEGAIMRSPKHAAIFQAAQKEEDAAKKPVMVSGAGGTLVNPQTGATIAAIPSTEPPSLQQKEVMVDGKPSIVNYNPKTGQHLDSAGQDVSARVKPIPPKETGTANAPPPPGDWDKTGADFLPTIPVQWRKTVEKIAKYEEDPTKVASMRGGNRALLAQWVNQVNPDYDQSKFGIRTKTRQSYTTGTQGQQINAINTAIGHIDQLSTVADELQNGGFTPGNKAWNVVRTAFGASAVTNFDTLKDALSGEVASVLSKGVGTVAGIKDAQEKINAANSPKQLAGYVKTLIPIMGSKLAELDAQYKQAMGDNDSFAPLSDRSKSILTKMGFDPSHPTIAASGAAAPKAGPQIGERRLINGQQGEWDGKGWKAVQ